jgi:hypothetical protein
LIAGVFVFWGLLLTSAQAVDAKLVGLSGILVTFLMSIWILFAYHYRQIYRYKLHRIWELEQDLHMEQHLRFVSNSKTKFVYHKFGPAGHFLDIAIFVVTSLGGSFIGYFRTPSSPWLLLPLPVVVTVVIWTLVNDWRVQKALDPLKKQLFD